MANTIVQQINAELEVLQKELSQFKSTVEYLNGAKTHVKEAIQSVNLAEEHFNNKVEELKSTYNSFIKLTDSALALISKIDTVNFPEKLGTIENAVKQTIISLDETKKATIEELRKASEIIVKADFDGRFKKLQISIDSSVKSNESVAHSIEKQKLPEKIEGLEKSINRKLETSISELQKNTKQIAAETAKSVHELNLPTRIDKLDANISGILSAIQNVQSRIESVERNIGDKLKDASEKQSSVLSAFQDKILNGLTALEKDIKTTAKQQQNYSYITWTLIVIGIIIVTLIIKL